MRFLYVAPRYHTNQIPIMKGLTENGHEVKFLSHYAGKIEDYTYVVPVIIGYSAIYRVFDYIYVHLIHKNDPKSADKKLLIGFPPLLRLNKELKEWKPDVVVIRERSVYSMVTYLLCRCHHYKTILYNQSPVYDNIKNDIPHKIVRTLTPNVRMTPVLGRNSDGKEKEAGTFFVPFVMELELSPDRKTYCRNGIIHIFCVGKYEQRKNLLMLIEVIKDLAAKYEISLTIAGECSTEFHRKYYQKAKKMVEEAGLKDKVSLLQNLSREEMKAKYAEADLFVIPSTQEPASISQLEAMAFSVPVICSDMNGSACYVNHGHNGFLFKDNDMESLKLEVEKIVANEELLVQMGKNSYLDVKNKYQFENYFEGIMECMQYLEK